MSGVELAAIMAVSLAAEGATTMRSVEAQRSAGKIAKMESETEAQQIELAAIQREADRKEQLAAALASQIATSGIRGISAFEGSPLTILQADIEREEMATKRDIMQSRIAAMTTRARGTIAKETARAGAGLTLLSGASSIGMDVARGAQTMQPLVK